LKQAFLDFVTSRCLIESGDRILVALSGGADSTCLLHLLNAAGFDLAAAHLHHSQREEGDADVDHCRALCEALDIPLYVGRADVPAVAKTHKIGLEEAGRKLRYEFLQMVASDGFRKMATGHTMDDTLETMLLNLCRGAGMRGMSGIPASRDNIVRPILFATREQTEGYCRENGLSFIDDSCNRDLNFGRNRIRHTVTPILKSINPACLEHASATATMLAEEDKLLDGLAVSHLNATEMIPSHSLAFLQSRIGGRWLRSETLPLPIVRRCVAIAMRMYGATLDRSSLEAIARAILAGSRASFTAEGGSVVVSSGQTGWHVRTLEKPLPFRQLLTVPGETIADELGWSLAAWYGETDASPLSATLDATALKGAIFARSLVRNDRIDPPGRGTGKSLTQRLSRAGISEQLRAHIPVVCDMLGPVWAPVVGPDRRAAATESTLSPLALLLGSAAAAVLGTTSAV
jgi:tRNA(Ile)-lysidine synthase